MKVTSLKRRLKKWLINNISGKFLLPSVTVVKLLIYNIPSMLLLPIIFVVRLLRPLILIRFGAIRSDRIGHFAGNTDIYLCERMAGIHGGRTIDFFYLKHPPCNTQLKIMLKRKIYIHPAIHWLAIANSMLPGSEKHSVEMKTDRDDYGYISRFKTHFSFTAEEEALGEQYLKSHGLNDGDKFICFMARDDRYLKESLVVISSSSGTGVDWSHNNFRNASINTVAPVIEKLVEIEDYHAFRMGYLVEKTISTENAKIIDYANNGDRSDFLDIYLAAKCHLFIVSGSGFYAIPRMFRRNIVAVNLIPVGYIGGKFTCFIPKKLRWKDKDRLVSFREILNPPGLQLSHSELYEKAGIEWIDNTPEEISEVVMEAISRIKNNWELSKEDMALHQKCISIFSNYAKRYEIAAQTSFMGTQFLRDNVDLLE